ncbi:MAG TPA: hypothetical protein PLO37_21295 [Candidatus Hydrogenedentes bacterium]|nr:hypothetical protein [Candidatus Hydrogenedentota bacterium]HPG69389.1 hypothetical protein [Candidatus Hydrogenedentota bacterium]
MTNSVDVAAIARSMQHLRTAIAAGSKKCCARIPGVDAEQGSCKKDPEPFITPVLVVAAVGAGASLLAVASTWVIAHRNTLRQKKAQVRLFRTQIRRARAATEELNAVVSRLLSMWHPEFRYEEDAVFATWGLTPGDLYDLKRIQKKVANAYNTYLDCETHISNLPLEGTPAEWQEFEREKSTELLRLLVNVDSDEKVAELACQIHRRTHEYYKFLLELGDALSKELGEV